MNSIQSLKSLCCKNINLGLNSCNFNFKKLLSFSEKKPELFKKLLDTLKPTEAPLFIGLIHLVSQWNNPDPKDRHKYFQLFTENVLNKLTIAHSGFAWLTLLGECILNRKDDDQLLLELLDLFFANADTATEEAFVAIERLLIHSCKENHSKVLAYLIEKKVIFNADLLIRLAVKEGHSEIVRLLIEKGANVNQAIERATESSTTLLHEAVQGGHLETAQLLIAKGADVHARKHLQMTPLHSACNLGHFELVKLLLKNGADINAKDIGQSTPLAYSCSSGHIEIAKYLLEKGAEDMPKEQLQMNFTYACKVGYYDIVKLLVEKGAEINVPRLEMPLHNACAGGHLNIVQFLISQKAAINVKTHAEMTALHEASKNGHLEIVQLLIKEGAEINAKTTENVTPLYFACTEGFFDIAELLIKNKADVNAKKEFLFTPLHTASMNGHFPIVKLLIQNRAEIDAKTEDEMTPLHEACQFGHLNIAQFLFENKATLHTKNTQKLTPLHSACISGHLLLVQFLLEHESDVNAIDFCEYTPLHHACSKGQLDIVKLLIQHGAEIDAKSGGQYTPLQIACERGHLEVARFLIENKASIMNRDNSNLTPFHIACGYGYLSIVELLLKGELDINAVDTYGNTPLHYASMNGRFDVVKLLLTKETNIHVKRVDNCTPLHLACDHGHHHIAKLLLEKGADVNAAIPEKKHTALHFACRNDHQEIVELLLEQKDLNSGILLPLITQTDFLIIPKIALLLIDKAKSSCTEIYILESYLVKNLLLLQREEEAKKYIEAWFERKDCSHFLEISLKKGNEKIADFLTEQFPDKLKDYLQNIRLSSDDKLRVLSLLSPTEIRETIRILSEDKKEELLCQVIDLDGVKSIVQILLGLRNEFLNTINWDDFNKINPDSPRLTDAEKDLLERGNTALLTSAEYLSKIPSSCLAVATSELQYQPIILSCLSVIGGRELCVVIPQLSKFIFVTALPNLKRQLQRACLNVATPMQKKAYLANLLFPTIKEGQELLKQTLDVTILRPKIAKILPLLKQDLAFLQQLLKVLGHDETIEEHSNAMTKLIKDLEILATQIQKITQLEDEQELPLDYLCAITRDFAVDPVFCNKLYTYDRASLAQCSVCPMTRLPIKIEETCYLLEHFKKGKEPTQELIDQNYKDLEKIRTQFKEDSFVQKKIDETKEKLAELTRKLDKQEM